MGAGQETRLNQRLAEKVLNWEPRKEGRLEVGAWVRSKAATGETMKKKVQKKKKLGNEDRQHIGD